jgi:hypothetical protein
VLNLTPNIGQIHNKMFQEEYDVIVVGADMLVLRLLLLQTWVQNLLVTMSLHRTLRKCLVILLWEELQGQIVKLMRLVGTLVLSQTGRQSNLRC